MSAFRIAASKDSCEYLVDNTVEEIYIFEIFLGKMELLLSHFQEPQHIRFYGLLLFIISHYYFSQYCIST